MGKFGSVCYVSYCFDYRFSRSYWEGVYYGQ